MLIKLNHVLMIAGIVALVSCAKKEADTEEAAGNDWPELESFHEVMADAYHPVADSGNMEPARRLSAALEERAATLASSVVPENARGEETTNNLTVLRDSTVGFSKAVKAGQPDSVLRPSITYLHRVFHHLMEAGSGKMEHHK